MKRHPSHRTIVGSLLESMEVCDATRSHEANPYQRVRDNIRFRRLLRGFAAWLCLCLALLFFAARATVDTTPPARAGITLR